LSQKEDPLPVESLDHVNIATADLDRAEAFYRELLDLESRAAPQPMTHLTARWMCDRAGRAILHLNSLDYHRHFDRDMSPGPTGALHHVALRCIGHAETLTRIERIGLDYRLNEVTAIGLRQIFVHDFDGVLLELNFFAE
jgi:catechol 2,3-dioxygenase-like lactoylglutathione lyase family enzyme